MTTLNLDQQQKFAADDPLNLGSNFTDQQKLEHLHAGSNPNPARALWTDTATDGASGTIGNRARVFRNDSASMNLDTVQVSLPIKPQIGNDRPPTEPDAIGVRMYHSFKGDLEKASNGSTRAQMRLAEENASFDRLNKAVRARLEEMDSQGLDKKTRVIVCVESVAPSLKKQENVTGSMTGNVAFNAKNLANFKAMSSGDTQSYEPLDRNDFLMGLSGNWGGKLADMFDDIKDRVDFFVIGGPVTAPFRVDASTIDLFVPSALVESDDEDEVIYFDKHESDSSSHENDMPSDNKPVRASAEQGGQNKPETTPKVLAQSKSGPPSGFDAFVQDLEADTCSGDEDDFMKSENLLSNTVNDSNKEVEENTLLTSTVQTPSLQYDLQQNASRPSQPASPVLGGTSSPVKTIAAPLEPASHMLQSGTLFSAHEEQNLSPKPIFTSDLILSPHDTDLKMENDEPDSIETSPTEQLSMAKKVRPFKPSINAPVEDKRQVVIEKAGFRSRASIRQEVVRLFTQRLALKGRNDVSKEQINMAVDQELQRQMKASYNRDFEFYFGVEDVVDLTKAGGDPESQVNNHAIFNFFGAGHFEPTNREIWIANPSEQMIAKESDQANNLQDLMRSFV